ncbi:MAG: DUF2971 domain-containing protein [Candidatus Paceibacterota bacterium]
MNDWLKERELIDELIKRDSKRELVAHYTKREIVVENILPDFKLKFSSLNNSNDPAEYILKITSAFLNEDFNPEEVFKELDKYLVNNIYTFCTCLSHKENKNLKISLSSFGKPKMWAHYGQNHEGICLVFNKKRLNHEIRESLNKEIWSKEIDYSEKEISISKKSPYSISIINKNKKEEILKHLDDHYEELLFRKKKDWESEKEFRWAFFEKEEISLIEFKDSLVAVVLGGNELSKDLRKYHKEFNRKKNKHI